jgi:hypothetical protein
MNQECIDKLLHLGKTQINMLFEYQDNNPLGDSEWIPRLEILIIAFEKIGLENIHVDVLWQYAYQIYDRFCKKYDPSYNFKENKKLMDRYRITNDS